MEDVFAYHSQLLLPEHDTYAMFLSYRQYSDMKLARRLAFSLQRNSDLSVFRDEDCLPIGRPFDFEFLKALCHSEVYVPLLSAQAIARFSEPDAHEQMDNFD
eukprot:m.163850 g.163850  ORF g.163850 m.163850 type:complete len:102 (+) comp16562_c0_seq2:254-559(+)